MTKIFISHSVKDKEIADAFVDIILHGAMSIDLEDIFCISTEGTKIKSGDDWRDSIKQSLLSSKVTFLIITPNYKESEMSLNEMGAAWVLSSLVLPTIVEPITFKTVGVIPEVTQVKKLLDEIHLDDLRDRVQAALGIPAGKIASGRWTQKKKEFIKRVKKHIEDNPFSIPMDRDTFNSLIEENDNLDKTVDNLLDEKQILEQQIKELESAKDLSAVKAIKKKYEPSSQVADFKTLCREVNSNLYWIKPIVRGVIFRSYTNKQIKIEYQAYKNDIDEADAEDYITVDQDSGEVDADWHTTKTMEGIYHSLREVDNFIEGDLTDSFYEEYGEKFRAPLKMDNKSFWEEVFNVVIYIN